MAFGLYPSDLAQDEPMLASARCRVLQRRRQRMQPEGDSEGDLGQSGNWPASATTSVI